MTVFGNGGRTRHILLFKGTWEALSAIRGETGEDGPVFVSRKGSPLSASQAFRIVRQAARRAGVEKDVSPHWLRHCHGSHALDRDLRCTLFRPPWGTSPTECNVNLVMLHSARCEEVGIWFA